MINSISNVGKFNANLQSSQSKPASPNFTGKIKISGVDVPKDFVSYLKDTGPTASVIRVTADSIIHFARQGKNAHETDINAIRMCNSLLRSFGIKKGVGKIEEIQPALNKAKESIKCKEILCRLRNSFANPPHIIDSNPLIDNYNQPLLYSNLNLTYIP